MQMKFKLEFLGANGHVQTETQTSHFGMLEDLYNAIHSYYSDFRVSKKNDNGRWVKTTFHALNVENDLNAKKFVKQSS